MKRLYRTVAFVLSFLFLAGNCLSASADGDARIAMAYFQDNVLYIYNAFPADTVTADYTAEAYLETARVRSELSLVQDDGTPVSYLLLIDKSTV